MSTALLQGRLSATDPVSSALAQMPRGARARIRARRRLMAFMAGPFFCRKCILFDDSCLNTSGYTVPETTDNRGDLLLELHITDNIVCQGKGKQLYLQPDDYKNYQYIKGAKFKPEPGTVIIYATTRKLADINSTEACLNYTYFHQQRPILFPIRTVEKLIDIQEYLTVEKNKYYYIFIQESFLVYKENDSYHHWVMPGYEYNLPKKSKLEVK
jgi:hypothetical protein